jgi:hypothetical protein
MLQTEVVEKFQIHILCLVTFSENRAFCALMGKNMVERGGPHDDIIRRMGIACRIIKARIHTLVSNTYSIFIVTLVTRTRIEFTLYAHCPVFRIELTFNFVIFPV